MQQLRRLFSGGLLVLLLTAPAAPGAAQEHGTVSGWNLVKVAGFDPGEYDATSVAGGSLEIGYSDGWPVTVAKITGGSNAYARGQWQFAWEQGTVYRTEGYFFLPEGFHGSMQGAVQLVGWDTYPVLNNQMRLIIWESDWQARLFLKTDGQDSEVTNSFGIPEGRWVHLAIEQRIAEADGWSRVYLDGALVAQGSGDTATPHPVTRMRYGLVAVDAAAQSNPLSMLFSDVQLSVAG